MKPGSDWTRFGQVRHSGQGLTLSVGEYFVQKAELKPTTHQCVLGVILLQSALIVQYQDMIVDGQKYQPDIYKIRPEQGLNMPKQFYDDPDNVLHVEEE